MKRRRHGLRLLVGISVAVAVALAFWLGIERRSPTHSSSSRPVAIDRALAAYDRLPATPTPAFRPARPVLLDRSAHEIRWAPVMHETVGRRSPEAGAAPVADLATTTPEGTTNLVVVKTETTAADGSLWARVELPVLPNGTLGWVPRSALGGYQFVSTRLVVDRERLVATLYRDGRPVFRAPVGVGQPQWPTPAGEFYIREKLTKFRSPFYGPIAFGTNARSPVLTDWPGGGFIGIHGTDEPGILPGRVSHGCVRLRNADILRLDRLMPVGTPVTIE